MADTELGPDVEPEVATTAPPFSEFETLALSVLLDDSLVRLNLLKHVIGSESDATQPQPTASGRTAAASRRTAQQLEQQQQPSSVVRQKANQLKLERIRQETFDILNATLAEMKCRGSFSALENDVTDKKASEEEEEGVFVREVQLKESVAHLSQHLVALRHDTENQLRSRDEDIVKLKTGIQAVRREWKGEEPKIARQCDEKIERHNAECIEREEELWRQIQDLKTSIDEELKSHDDIKTFLENCKTDLRERCDELCAQYDNDLSLLEEKIVTTQAATDAARTESIRLTAVFQDYTKVIEENREQEEIKNQQMVYFIKETAACKIQKWWRMHTVAQRIDNAQKKKKKVAKKRR